MRLNTGGTVSGQAMNAKRPRQSRTSPVRRALAQAIPRDEIVAHSHVKVADNYQVKPPEQQPAQQLPPGFGAPPEQEAAPAPSPAKPAAKPAAKPKQK